MNSLEFIEKEIEHQKIIIKVNTSLLSQFNENDDVAQNVLKGKILVAENQLQTLHQIKSELKAWEVIKDKFHFEVYKRNDNDYLLIMKLGDEEECFGISKNEYNNLKALEVEDQM